jgi:hypothetical protein
MSHQNYYPGQPQGQYSNQYLLNVLNNTLDQGPYGNQPNPEFLGNAFGLIQNQAVREMGARYLQEHIGK